MLKEKLLTKYPKLSIFLKFIMMFATFWSIVGPLGGIDFLKNDYVIYVISALIFLLIAIIISIEIEQKKNIGETRSKVEYNFFLKNTNEYIILVGYSLPTFTKEQLLHFLKILINQKKVNVKVIILNPFSPLIYERPIFFNKIETTENRSIDSLKKFLNFKNTLEDINKFKIGIINILPNIGVVMNEEKILWSPYLLNRSGTEAPYVVINKKSPLFNIFKEHVDILWEKFTLKITEKTTAKDVIDFMNNDPLIKIKTFDSTYIKNRLSFLDKNLDKNNIK